MKKEVHICTSGVSPGSTGEVRIWRSSGQGRGHRSNKGRKSLFPQCKTSIVNNFGSRKHTAMNFACSMGFPLWRIEWCDRYLSSRDRKRTRVTKRKHSRVVGLRLEGNLVVVVVIIIKCTLCRYKSVGDVMLTLKYGELNVDLVIVEAWSTYGLFSAFTKTLSATIDSQCHSINQLVYVYGSSKLDRNIRLYD